AKKSTPPFTKARLGHELTPSPTEPAGRGTHLPDSTGSVPTLSSPWQIYAHSASSPVELHPLDLPPLVRGYPSAVAPEYPGHALLIHCPPQILTCTVDGEEDLIQMSLVARSRTPAAQLMA